MVGVDEVGRGAWAGPLAVGAVLVRDVRDIPDGLDDSKRLTRLRREGLVAPLSAWAHGIAVGWVSAAEIDQMGLRVALAMASYRALADLPLRHEDRPLILVDGPLNLLSVPADVGLPPVGSGIPCPVDDVLAVVGGDGVSAVIAAASVIAKVARDDVMRQRDRVLPGYGWSRNVGYGTAEHRAALGALGPSIEHRRSWNLPVS